MIIKIDVDWLNYIDFLSSKEVMLKTMISFFSHFPMSHIYTHFNSPQFPPSDEIPFTSPLKLFLYSAVPMRLFARYRRIQTQPFRLAPHLE